MDCSYTPAASGGAVLLRYVCLAALVAVMGCGHSHGAPADGSVDVDSGGDAHVCDCDDGIACTDDHCDMAAGACSHVPNHSACGADWLCNPSHGCEPDYPPPEPCDFCLAPRGGWATCDPPAYRCETGCDAGYVQVGNECQSLSCMTTGAGCGPDAGCEAGHCIGERLEVIGGSSDPITGLPDGGVELARTAWSGGYCSPNVDDTGAVASECDPTDPSDPVCGECGRCVAGLCMKTCTASVVDNDDCRDGYDCSASLGACVPGCASDAECRVRREESNGLVGIQTPDDCRGDSMRPMASQVCGGVDENFDGLVYDASSTATCDPHTFRCTNPGTTGASAGIPCTHDDECEPGGECFTDSSGWPGGYCSKRICDLPGNGCAGAGECQDRRLGGHVCLQSCTVADGATTADPASWLTNTGGCRAGYACVWGGIRDDANGGCAPGNFNSITTNDVGGACSTDADCYSPFGQGFCLQPAADGSGFRDGYCTIMDCQAPGMPSDVCGASAVCVDIDGSEGDLTACLGTCINASDCRPTYGCVPLGGTSGSACLPYCTADSDCRASERCSTPTGPDLGSCVPR